MFIKIIFSLNVNIDKYNMLIGYILIWNNVFINNFYRNIYWNLFMVDIDI